MPSATLDLLAPAYSWQPEYGTTLGPEVADLCAAYGFAPDPEQRLILDAMFATMPSGRSIRDIGICAPRQNLKTGVLKMAALGWLFLLELPLVVWSAHEFDTTAEAFRDLCQLIEDNPDLDREILRTSRGKTGIKRGNGDELIELRGNRRIKFKARTKDGGRGLTGNRVILDEAMKLQGGTIAALVPTLRAVPDPQLVYAGSGGLLESVFWRSVRDRGRPGGDPALAWFEWGDLRPWECGTDECTHMLHEPACALDDESRLWACNSALHRGRMTMDSLRADRKTFSAFPVQYATETLGWWEDPPNVDGAADNGMPKWDAALTDRGAQPPFTLGLEVSADSRSAAVAIFGGGVAEVVDYRKGAGLGWVPGRVKELRAKYAAAVAVRSSSPTEQLRAQLGDDVTWLTAAEVVGACLGFATGINEGTVAHRDQASLSIAVGAADRKFAGEVWRWSLSGSWATRGVDISPLLACAWAVHIADNVDRSTEALLSSFG